MCQRRTMKTPSKSQQTRGCLFLEEPSLDRHVQTEPAVFRIRLAAAVRIEVDDSTRCWLRPAGLLWRRGAGFTGRGFRCRIAV